MKTNEKRNEDGVLLHEERSEFGVADNACNNSCYYNCV